MISNSEKDKTLMPIAFSSISSSSNFGDGIMTNGGLSVNGNLENRNSNSNYNLTGEMELLMLQQQLQQQNQRNRDLLIQRERDIDIFRSGSAPPTVEGSLNAVGGLFRNPSYAQLNDSGSGSFSGSVTNGGLTEEEIRSHPSYLAYYYSNENHNPRLPPPLLSKEDWRVAQRVGSSFGGAGDWWNKNVDDEGGSSSLFSMQPGLSVNKAEDELMELRKAAASNHLLKSPPQLLDRGKLEMSSANMGLRRKSFADIVQDMGGQPAKVEGRVSRPASRNSLTDNLVTSGIVNNHSTEQNKATTNGVLHPAQMVKGLSSVQNPGSLLHESFSSVFHSPSTRSRTPDPHLVRNADFRVGLVDSVADISNSLAGLNMSKDQYHNKDSSLQSQPHMGLSDASLQNMHPQFFDKSRSKNLANATNYPVSENGVVPPNLNNPSLGLNEQLNFPRRTYSSTSLYSQVNDPDFARAEDWNSYNLRNYHPATGLALQSASLNGGSLRRNTGQLGSNLPATLLDPRHVQHLHESYNHKMNAGLLPGNSSQMRNCIGSSRGLGNLQDFEKMYLDKFLAEQKYQYQSPVYRSSGLLDQYPGNPALDLCMPFHGNQMANSISPSAGSRTALPQNERMSRATVMLNHSVGNGSWHSEFETKIEGRLASTSLEELNNKTRSLELSEVLGRVVEFSTDQYGSRFIQQKLETATVEEKLKIFPEIMPHGLSLMTDVFGNYVIQKFFEHGTESQRKELASQLIGHVLPLSLQMYGCRVIQKALEVVDMEQRTQMVAELDGSVMKCVRDQNGNHVIQKCIECVPQDRIHFIISSFFGQVVTLSMHPYGCRVIQRVLEHCDDPKTQKAIMGEVMDSICTLAQDQYGNYVIQHILRYGQPHERSAIIRELAGQIVKISQQKFASNVVEKCLVFGSQEERQLLVNEMLGSTDENEPLQAMMKDPFGNYVVQKVLETCNDESREHILSRIRVHLNALKKYTYGKHIVSRVEKLITTGEKRKESSH